MGSRALLITVISTTKKEHFSALPRTRRHNNLPDFPDTELLANPRYLRLYPSSRPLCLPTFLTPRASPTGSQVSAFCTRRRPSSYCLRRTRRQAPHARLASFPGMIRRPRPGPRRRRIRYRRNDRRQGVAVSLALLWETMSSSVFTSLLRPGEILLVSAPTGWRASIVPRRAVERTEPPGGPPLNTITDGSTVLVSCVARTLSPGSQSRLPSAVTQIILPMARSKRRPRSAWRHSSG